MNVPPQRESPSRGRVALAFAAIYLIWGSTFLVTRLGVRELPPLLFATGRFVMAAALLVPLALARRERFPRGAREWRYMLLFPLLMIGLGNGLPSVALRHLPSNEGALLASSTALWIAGLGALGPRGHRLGAASVAGLLLGLVGVALLVWPKDAAPAGHPLWQSLVLIASLSGAIATILYRDARIPSGPMAFNAMTMVVGAAWLMLAAVVTGEPAEWRWSAKGLAAMAYLAVFGSAVAYTAYTWLLRHVRADRVATFAYVNPAIATLLGWLLLDEALGRPQIAGMLVVLAGVALVTLVARRD